MTRDPSVMSIQRANTVLYCRRWPETVAFYRMTLGLQVVFENEWFVEFELTPSSMLSIADTSRATIDAVDGQGLTLTWNVPNVREARTVLEARGVAVTEIKSRWGADVFYCHDPEGHRIELWADRI